MNEIKIKNVYTNETHLLLLIVVIRKIIKMENIILLYYYFPFQCLSGTHVSVSIK